jgi:hypothetical protein
VQRLVPIEVAVQPETLRCACQSGYGAG